MLSCILSFWIIFCALYSYLLLPLLPFVSCFSLTLLFLAFISFCLVSLFFIFSCVLPFLFCFLLRLLYYRKIRSKRPLHSKRPPPCFAVSAVSAHVHSKHPLALPAEIFERPPRKQAYDSTYKPANFPLWYNHRTCTIQAFTQQSDVVNNVH